MSNILDDILENTRARLTERKAVMPLEALKSLPFTNRTPIPFVKGLKKGSGVIAEHKRKSPSKGLFKPTAEFREIIEGYEKAGASALSVLTDLHFFGGSLADLRAARNTSGLPVLRKDFILDQYQIHEAKAYGADAILLIAAALDPELLKHLAEVAIDLDMDILLEVHDSDELKTALEQVKELPSEKIAIGVNNRDLKTFKTDIQTSKKLAKEIPDEYVKVSESGISDPDNVKKLRKLDYQGFLIGGYFMDQMDPILASSHFIKQL